MFEDDVDIAMTTKKITVGDPPKLIIADCNSTDTVLHTGVTAPSEWRPYKYTYDGTTWVEDSDFDTSHDEIEPRRY